MDFPKWNSPLVVSIATVINGHKLDGLKKFIDEFLYHTVVRSLNLKVVAGSLPFCMYQCRILVLILCRYYKLSRFIGC